MSETTTMSENLTLNPPELIKMEDVKKPSDLIKLGLQDLWACEQDEHYKISMSNWHKPSYFADWPEAECTVCLVGAIMAKSFQESRDLLLDPSHFAGRKLGVFNASWAFRALEEFRCGWINSGLTYINLPPIAEFVGYRIRVVNYVESRQGFYASMREVIAKLEAYNL